MLICNVVGARPNFMKAAPVISALQARGIPQFLVHTGQHFDERMSGLFFRDLGLPRPDVFLGIEVATPVVQTAQVLMALERVLQERQPGLVLVYGDVTSTVAAGLAARKAGIRVAHVEAGLRSFDPEMPEELNRVLTDHLSQLLFTTEESGRRNLLREGMPEDAIHFVGNCMVDSLLKHLPEALARRPWEKQGLSPQGYAVLTLHRPGNVDNPDQLRETVRNLGEIAARTAVLFPVHPRTLACLERHGIALPASVLRREPLSYLEFVGLMSRARFVMTDSGGIQEETTVLQVPCLTLRANTERPVTVEMGTNRLVDHDRGALLRAVEEIFAGTWPKGRLPPLWDGRAGDRIAAVIENALP